MTSRFLGLRMDMYLKSLVVKILPQCNCCVIGKTFVLRIVNFEIKTKRESARLRHFLPTLN